MSQENVELLQRAYEYWNTDEADQWLALFHPDIEFIPSGVFPGLDPVYRGHAGMARFRDEMLEAWEHFHIDTTKFLDRGEFLGVELRFRGKGKTSGVEVDLNFHHGVRIRDGLIYRLSSNEDLDEALEAVGMRN